MTTTTEPPCLFCRRFLGDRRCEAFRAAEIPNSIWLGGNDHRTPIPGDGGLLFDPLPETETLLADRDSR